jgi:outer membrane protein
MRKLLLVFAILFGAGLAMAQTRVASVNTSMIMDSLPSWNQTLETIEEIRLSGLAELQEMQTSLNKAVQNFREKEKDMAPVVRELEEKKLMQKDQEIQIKQQSLQEDLQRVAQELQDPIIAEVREAIGKVAEANKYDYVVEQPMLLYFSDAHDITKKVAAQLKKTN